MTEGKQRKWESGQFIAPEVLYKFLVLEGAASTRQIKEHFHTDSASVRRSLALLMAADLVWSVPSGVAQYWMPNTHEPGRPTPNRRIAEARRLRENGETPEFPDNPLKINFLLVWEKLLEDYRNTDVFQRRHGAQQKQWKQPPTKKLKVDRRDEM